MRALPRILTTFLATLAGAAVPALAHPGHAHTDIPGLIRHPFAGPEHFLGSAACGLGLAALLYVVTRRTPMPALVRWGGLSAVAIGIMVMAPV